MTGNSLILHLATMYLDIHDTRSAITHKTYFSEAADYWLVRGCILFVWLLTMVATYLDGKKYLSKKGPFLINYLHLQGTKSPMV